MNGRSNSSRHKDRDVQSSWLRCAREDASIVRDSRLKQCELKLVRRANYGDAAAFEAIYHKHRDWVIALARRLTGDATEALDIQQEAFANLFSRFPGFELTASVRGFLFPVVRNLCFTMLRQRRRMVPLEAVRQEAQGELTRPPPSVFELDKLVKMLPESQRQVVLLRFGAQPRLKEIAATLGIPIGTVKSRLHKALKSLRTEQELQP